MKRAKEAAERLGLAISFVKSYHLHPKLIEALTIRVNNAFEQLDDVSREDVRVIFTAHSLPEKILEMNDPYPEQLLETSRAIAGQTGIPNWQFGWQSAGQTAIPWLGPDILDTLQTLAREEQVKNVLVSPIGFVSDHLEVLYDLDIEAQQLAGELGLKLVRTESLNTDPLYMETLAETIAGELRKSGLSI
jgi:ferrochelatase